MTSPLHAVRRLSTYPCIGYTKSAREDRQTACVRTSSRTPQLHCCRAGSRYRAGFVRPGG